MKKEELMKDLKFCQELMDRLVKYTDLNYKDDANHFIENDNHTVIQNDIIRLRRELNEIRNKLDQ
jgi:hypothetical protein